MPELTTTDQPANSDSQEDQSAQNPDEQSAGTVSPAAPSDDLANRLAALEAQLERERERNNGNEQSLKIYERFLQQRDASQTPTAPAKSDDGWTPEHDILEKALDPVLKKRFGTYLDGFAQQNQSVLEETDALKFEMFLQRNNPEILADEDEFAKTMQQVEAVRQAGRQRGMNVSRVDAFVFNEGLQGTKRKGMERKQKRTNALTTEARRQAEVSAASISTDPATPRASAIAGIQSIRQKAARGERLSPDEKKKLFDFAGNIEI